MNEYLVHLEATEVDGIDWMDEEEAWNIWEWMSEKLVIGWNDLMDTVSRMWRVFIITFVFKRAEWSSVGVKE